MRRKGYKRYNLELPDPLFDDLQKLADDNHTTVAYLLRQFSKLGLLAMEEDTRLLIERDGEINEIMIFL